MGLPVCRSITFSVGLVIAVVGAILGFAVFPSAVNSSLKDDLALINGTVPYERWEHIPFPIQFKIYFFNVTNPDEVAKGEKPNVHEIGPYYYDQQKYRVNVAIENDTLSYKERMLFYFNAEKSKPLNEDDPITIVNLPLLSVLLLAETKFPEELGGLNLIIKKMFEPNNGLFVKTTAKEFLFDGIQFCHIKEGSSKPLKYACDRIKSYGSKQLQESEDGSIKFSFLSFKNNSPVDQFRINSGSNDLTKLGELYEWKNSPKLNVWGENGTCNDLFGTDATLFPPYQTPESRIAVFQPDICRTVVLGYDKDSEYKDVKGHRYIVTSDMLASPKKLPANDCFCAKMTKGILGNDSCLLDGAMEVYPCLDAPIVVTTPHFFEADKTYQDTIDGFEPNETLHRTFIELEPTTGVILQGSKRAQFNIFFRYIKPITITKKLVTSLVPILWIDEGVQLNDEYMKILTDKLAILQTLDIVKWCLIGGGLTISLVTLISFIVI